MLLVFRAFVDINNELNKMHGTYVRLIELLIPVWV
jgi:hypothetical protein